MKESLKQNPGSDKDILRCWAQQNCGGCLDQDHCSWCPFTQSCVPNNYLIPPLAPAYDEDICPHWAERWDIRTRPLGCQVSTITSLTCIISVAAALLFVLLSFLLIRGIQWLKALHRRDPTWWRARWTTDTRCDRRQQQPLLGGWSVPPEVPVPEGTDPGHHSNEPNTDNPSDGDTDSDSDSS